MDHRPLLSERNARTSTAEIEDYINRVADSDLWLKENRPVFKWGGSSMIEDRGEVFPALEIDPDHPAVSVLVASHSAVKNRSPSLMFPKP